MFINEKFTDADYEGRQYKVKSQFYLVVFNLLVEDKQ